MSYFKPYIDESGFHYPTYNDILEDLINECQRIYGSGCYLGNDSQDYQLLSVIADKIYDSYQTCEITYNAHSPVTAIGTTLDYIVAINGIMRRQGTKSTAVLTLSGAAGVTVANGAVSDVNGYMWDLPSTIVIGSDGTVDALGVCREPGLITAPSGTINHIMTPTAGWMSVTNDADAQPGTVTETDSELRSRRADSVSYPSQSLLLGLKGALISLKDVNRCEVYENDTGATNENGIPGHSICCIVEGGDQEEIADTIIVKKGPGCGTYGSVSQEVIDVYGQRNVIRFSRPKYIDIDIAITLSRRSGYKASTPDEIRAAIVSYLDTFTIGTDLTPSIIWMIAQEVNVDKRTPTFAIESVTASRHGEPLGTQDIQIAFDEVAKGRTALIAITVT